MGKEVTINQASTTTSCHPAGWRDLDVIDQEKIGNSLLGHHQLFVNCSYPSGHLGLTRAASIPVIKLPLRLVSPRVNWKSGHEK